MDLGLTGKRALVTGGGRGIGRAICLGLAREGASVAVCARTASDLNDVEETIARAGGHAVAVQADVGTRDGARAAVDAAVTKLGGLDVLVNNVGGSQGTGPFDTASHEDWQRVVDLNLMSAVWCSQRAVEAMTGRGGTIVHIGSVYGREYGPSAPYVAAKGALVSLTKEMGVDLARHGIRVCCVAPGSIMFPGGSWDRRRQSDPERVEATRSSIPWGRFGTAEEVADVVVFLSSPRASWVTGATLPVDGGQGRMP